MDQPTDEENDLIIDLFEMAIDSFPKELQEAARDWLMQAQVAVAFVKGLTTS